MIFRSIVLLLLLISQPLAALDLACSDVASGAPASEHCAGMDHGGDDPMAESDQGDHDTPCADSCDACAAGIAAALSQPAAAPVASTDSAQMPRTQFAAGFSGALFRPPILK